MSSTRRPPAPTCAVCGRHRDEVRGRRLVISKARSISFASAGLPLPGKSHSGKRHVQLAGRFQHLVLVLWGPWPWPDAGIERAKGHAQDGCRPWTCQLCDGYTCDACGSASAYPGGAEVLYDDGTIGHCALLPAPPGCLNPACPRCRGGEAGTTSDAQFLAHLVEQGYRVLRLDELTSGAPMAGDLGTNWAPQDWCDWLAASLAPGGDAPDTLRPDAAGLVLVANRQDAIIERVVAFMVVDDIDPTTSGEKR
jgi:hypothetical protein